MAAGTAFIRLDAWQVMLLGVLFFAALYLLTGLANRLLTTRWLPRRGYGRPLDTRPLPPGQLKREWLASASSILIFGIGLLVPWGMLRQGWAGLAVDPSPVRIALEILVLFCWNELHFYLNHRLLHTPALRRFHVQHHRSHIATPWSTYAFHPVEALMLGSVPLIPMMLHDFSFIALASLPVLSIVLNNIGHSNYEFSRKAPATGWRSASRRHHLHHACYRGNYGFLLPVFDHWFGTALPADALQRKSQRRDGRGTR